MRYYQIIGAACLLLLAAGGFASGQEYERYGVLLSVGERAPGADNGPVRLVVANNDIETGDQKGMICASPDGSMLYTTFDWGLSAYEASSGRLLWSLSDATYQEVYCESNRVITFGVAWSIPFNVWWSFDVFDSGTGVKLASVEGMGVAVLSPDEKYLWVQGNKVQENHVIDLSTGEVVTVPFTERYDESKSGLERYDEKFRPFVARYGFDRGREIDAAGAQKIGPRLSAKLEKIIENQPVAKLAGIRELDNGKCLIATREGKLISLDWASGQIEDMETNRGGQRLLAASPDGQTVVLADQNGDLTVVKAGETVKIINTELPDPGFCTVDQSGTVAWLAAADDLKLINLITGQQQHQGKLGKIVGLEYDQKTDEAVVIVDSAGGEAYCRKKELPLTTTALKDLKAKKLEIRNLDKLYSGCSKENTRSPERIFLGYSTEHDVLFYQNDIGIRTGSPIMSIHQASQNLKIDRKISNTSNECDALPGVLSGYSDIYHRFSKAVFSGDGQVAALFKRSLPVSREIVNIFDPNNVCYGSEIFSGYASIIPAFKGYERFGEITDGFFIQGRNRLLTLGNDNVVRLWDMRPEEGELLLSFIFFKNGNYVVLDKNYRFDTPDLDGLDGVYWVSERMPGRTLPLDSFMRDYYQPRLAEYVLAGQALPPLSDISNKNLFQAEVEILAILPEPAAGDEVNVVVEVRAGQKAGEGLSPYSTEPPGNHRPDGKQPPPGQVRIQPTMELKLFRDGRLVGTHRPKDGLIHFNAQGRARVVFSRVALPRGKNQVVFKAYAFNEDKVRSQVAVRDYAYQPSGRPEPHLKVVALGVNTFDNSAWNLKYAANDARAYSRILPLYLSAGSGADVTLLTEGDGALRPAKSQVEHSIKKLARKARLKEGEGDDASGPDDLMVISISTHGLTENGKFYLLPADIPPDQGRRVTPELLERAITADELARWLADVDAREIVLIIDACQSGASVGGREFKPGPMGDQGLGQLAYDKAIRVLCATNENNAALEHASLNHGVMTYALIREGLEAGKIAAAGNRPTVRDWLIFGKQRTAALYADIRDRRSPDLVFRGDDVLVDEDSLSAQGPGREPFLFDSGGDSWRLNFPPEAAPGEGP